MTVNSDNVRVALTGDFVTAPLGTPIPGEADDPWPSGWVDLGYLSTDGITESANDTLNEINAWQDNAVVRQSKSWAPSLGLTVIETTEAVVELFYPGADITSTVGGGKQVDVGAPVPDRRMFGFTVIDGTEVERVVFFEGELGERDDRSHTYTDPSGWPITVTAYPASAHSGLYMRRLYADLPGPTLSGS